MTTSGLPAPVPLQRWPLPVRRSAAARSRRPLQKSIPASAAPAPLDDTTIPVDAVTSGVCASAVCAQSHDTHHTTANADVERSTGRMPLRRSGAVTGQWRSSRGRCPACAGASGGEPIMADRTLSRHGQDSGTQPYWRLNRSARKPSPILRSVNRPRTQPARRIRWAGRPRHSRVVRNHGFAPARSFAAVAHSVITVK